MVMSNKQNDTLRNDVFVAARAQSNADKSVYAAIRKAIPDWSDADRVKEIGLTYQAARMCASLNLKSELQALALISLKPHKDGTADGHRSFNQQLAWNAARSAWSTASKLAGAPNKRDGKTRAPRTTVAKPAEAVTLPNNLLPAITKAKSVADMHAYALRIAGNVAKYVNANSKYVTGDMGALLRGFAESVAKCDIDSKVA